MPDGKYEVRYKETEDKDPSPSVVVSIVPDAPEVETEGKKITKVDDTMEYRPVGGGDDDWVSVPAGQTETPDLPDGDYEVRYKETADKDPSPTTTVTIKTTTTRRGGGSSRASATPTPSPTADPNTGGNGSGNGSDTPELIKDDHFAYVSGYEDETFRPDTPIRRGEVAAIFARLISDTMEEKGSYTPSFTDMTPDMFFYKQVGFLEQYGILSGYTDNTFKPWENITRAEFAVVASKFAKLTETEENPFTDVKADFWGTSYILLAHANGWISGYEDNTFKPQANITRAEVVSIVNRMLERVCDEDYIKEHAEDISVYKDITSSHWAYNDIIEASNGHEFVIDNDKETWTELK